MKVARHVPDEPNWSIRMERLRILIYAHATGHESRHYGLSHTVTLFSPANLPNTYVFQGHFSCQAF